LLHLVHLSNPDMVCRRSSSQANFVVIYDHIENLETAHLPTPDFVQVLV